MGDNVPDVKTTEPTPLLEKSAMPIPGLKHHQLKVLVFDTLAESRKQRTINSTKIIPLAKAGRLRA